MDSEICQKGLDFNGAVVQRILTKTIVIAAIYNRFFTCTQPVNDCTGVSSIRYAAILVFVEDADIFSLRLNKKDRTQSDCIGSYRSGSLTEMAY